MTRYILQYQLDSKWLDWCAFPFSEEGKANALEHCEDFNTARMEGRGKNVEWRVVLRADVVVT